MGEVSVAIETLLEWVCPEMSISIGIVIITKMVACFNSCKKHTSYCIVTINYMIIIMYVFFKEN